MKKIKRKQIILTLGSLAILTGLSTFTLLVHHSDKTIDTKASPSVKKVSANTDSEKLSETLKNLSNRREAGRDSFPDEETYNAYKKMRAEIAEGELIVEQSDPEVPNRKSFVGTKSEFIIENWSLEKDDLGNQVLKVPFKFINKSNENVDVKEYIKTRITAQQMVTESLHSLTDLTVEDYLAKIVVGPQRSYSGFLYIKTIQDKPNFGITFNVSYVSGGSSNRGGGAVLNV